MLLDEEKAIVLNNNFKINNGFEELLFPTKIESLGWIDENGMFRGSGMRAFMDARDNKILYAGASYEPVLNSQIVDAIEPLLENGFNTKDVRSYYGKKFEINLINENYGITINEHQAHLRMKIVNSYDGSQRLSVRMGAYIQVCSNGLCVGDYYDIVHKHTREIELNDMLLEVFENKKELIMNKLDNYHFGEIKTPVKDIFKQITGKLKDSKNKNNEIIHNKTKVIINELFVKQREIYGDQFGLFMAATDVATHGHKYGIPIMDQLTLENDIAKVYFN